MFKNTRTPQGDCFCPRNNLTGKLELQKVIRGISQSSRDTPKLNNTGKCSNDFSDRYEQMHFELEISKSCSSIQYDRIVNLERNVMTNAQSLRKESVDINQIPGTIPDSLIEEKLALSSTGHEVCPDIFELCHRLTFLCKMLKNDQTYFKNFTL